MSRWWIGSLLSIVIHAMVWHFSVIPVALSVPTTSKPLPIHLNLTVAAASKANSLPLPPMPDLKEKQSVKEEITHSSPQTTKNNIKEQTKQKVVTASTPSLKRTESVPQKTSVKTVKKTSPTTKTSSQVDQTAVKEIAATHDPKAFANDQSIVPVKLAAPLKKCYPAASKHRQEQGIAKIKTDISAKGKVLSYQLVQSTGYSRLDQCALEAVKAAKFIPAKQGNTPIVAQLTIEVLFELN